jgi:hypothetical protein
MQKPMYDSALRTAVWMGVDLDISGVNRSEELHRAIVHTTKKAYRLIDLSDKAFYLSWFTCRGVADEGRQSQAGCGPLISISALQPCNHGQYPA